MDSLVPARLISYLKRVTKHLFVNVVCHVETILFTERDSFTYKRVY